MTLLFLKLLLSHILGDFVFQTENLVKKRTVNAGFLLVHIGVHTALLFLFFIGEWDTVWQTLLFVLCVHLLIDSLKVLSDRRWPNRSFLIFCIDQLLHLTTLLLIVFYKHGMPEEYLSFILSKAFIIFLIAFLLIICVSPIILRVMFSKWHKELEIHNKKNESLIDAGWAIGVIERLLIVFFVLVDFLSGIGFLLAAKSIFRFGDLNNAKNTKFTEYVLIGTFTSFLLAMCIAYLLKLALIHLA